MIGSASWGRARNRHRGLTDSPTDLRRELVRAVLTRGRDAENRQIDRGKDAFDEGVPLLSARLLVAAVVELDDQDRRQVAGTAQNEIDVLLLDAILVRLPVFRASSDLDQIRQADLDENGKILRSSGRLQHVVEAMLGWREDGRHT